MDFIQLAPVIMFFLALFGLITSRNIIKSIICLVLLETAVIVFFLGMSFRWGILPPIGEGLAYQLDYIADPLPQALMLTAIIIGLALTVVNITMAIYLTRQTKSVDWQTVKLLSMDNTDNLDIVEN